MVTASDEGVASGDEIRKVSNIKPLAVEQRVEVLHALLNRYPDAYLVCTDEKGFTQPIPASIDVGRHRLLEMHSILEVIETSHRPRMIDFFDLAQQIGITQSETVVSGGVEAELSVLDVRATHGVVVALVVPHSDAEVRVADTEDSALLTRIASTKKDTLALFLDVDEATTRILGWTAEEMIGRRSLDFTHPDDHERAVAAWLNTMSNPLPARPVRLRYRRKDDSWIWMEIVNHSFLAEKEPYVLAEMIDISDEMGAQEALRDQEELLRRLAETLPLGIAQIDSEQRIVYSNERLQTTMEVELASTAEELFVNVIEDDRLRISEALDGVLSDSLETELEVQVDVPGLKRSSDRRTCSISIRALSRDMDKPYGAILSIADVTERARLQNELHIRAAFDELTGCWNRSSILTALANLDRDTGITVVFVDLDHFKPINDRLGHAAGDELLVIVAQRLRSAMRTGDLVGRIGGDEFLAVFPGVADPSEGARIADRVNAILCREAQLMAGMVTVRASIGYTWASRMPDNPEDLVADADAAMYEAKRLGLGKPVEFCAETAKFDRPGHAPSPAPESQI